MEKRTYKTVENGENYLAGRKICKNGKKSRDKKIPVCGDSIGRQPLRGRCPRTIRKNEGCKDGWQKKTIE